MLDLQSDFDAIYAHLVERVDQYDPETNDGPGEGADPIALVTLGFSFGEYSWLALVFDTRSEAEDDGEWTMWAEDNEFCMERWDDPLNSLNDSVPLTIQSSGLSKELTTYDEEAIAACIGELLVGVIKTARSNGVFQSLPLKPGATIGIEEYNGHYGWPLPSDQETGAIA